MSVFITAIMVLAVYLLPAIIANGLRRRNYDAILALNLLLGWTFIGWVVALVWALVNDK